MRTRSSTSTPMSLFSNHSIVRRFGEAATCDCSVVTAICCALCPGEQRIWSEHAGRVLGIVPVNPAGHDYIGTLIAWRRDALLSMCERIEKVTGRHWIAAIGRSRRFSECMIYGRYADEVLTGNGPLSRCRRLLPGLLAGTGADGRRVRCLRRSDDAGAGRHRHAILLGRRYCAYSQAAGIRSDAPRGPLYCAICQIG